MLNIYFNNPGGNMSDSKDFFKKRHLFDKDGGYQDAVNDFTKAIEF